MMGSCSAYGASLNLSPKSYSINSKMVSNDSMLNSLTTLLSESEKWEKEYCWYFGVPLLVQKGGTVWRSLL